MHRQFCIKWTDGDGTHRVSLGTADRSAAKATTREFWTRRTLATADTVGELMIAYLDSLNGGRDEKREAWRTAAPFWSGLRMTQIDRGTSAARATARRP